jgi:hypothetical protein
MGSYWLKKGFGYILMILVGLAILGYVFMLLWNMLIPEIFGLIQISYWQALGLLAMAKIVFGFGMMDKYQHEQRLDNKKEHWKKKIETKMEGMSEEEKAKFKESMKGWCYGKKD